MRYLSILLLVMLVTSTTFAQVSGNRNYSRKSGNVNYEAGNTNYGNNNNYQVPTNLPQATNNDPTKVFLNVKVLSNQLADSYIAIFNLTQMGKTAAETNQLLMDRYNGFAQELQQIGVPQSNIYLDMLSFVPIYEYEKEKKLFSKTYNEVPKGFQMQQNVHIKYVESSMMARIMAVAAKYEIYDLVKVDYIVDNQESVYVDMRQKAVEHLVKEIELYVEKLGVDLEAGYRIVSEDKQATFPIDRYSSYNAFSNVSLGGTPDKGKVQDMYKPKTMYYDRVVYDQFDIVINPSVLEPAVQFMYDLQVQMVVKSPLDEAAKKHLWLTPDGDIVPIKLED